MTIFNTHDRRSIRFRPVKNAVQKVVRLTELLFVAASIFVFSACVPALGNDYSYYGQSPGQLQLQPQVQPGHGQPGYGQAGANPVYISGFESPASQQNYVYQSGTGNSSYYNTPSINNYVSSTPTFVAANTSGESALAPYSSEYLTMGGTPTFRRDNAKRLEPRAPSYDHWSSMPDQPWRWQLLPDGLIFPSYLAGMKEPRLGTMWVHDKNFKWVWDASLGGRAGLLRFGSPNSLLPEGIQIDIEGAVLLRMDIENERDMMANDFRAGVPVTFGGKTWQFKLGYYHLSSHMGDEYTLRTGVPRLNYVRDSFVFAVARRFGDNWRGYAEAAWAFFTGDETEPWEFQVGLEYSPIYPARRFRGTPFAAVHLHVFQELDYSGYFCCQVGWQWRGKNNQLLRFGMQYLNGYDDQFEFHKQTTDKIGFGIWYDF